MTKKIRYRVVYFFMSRNEITLHCLDQVAHVGFEPFPIGADTGTLTVETPSKVLGIKRVSFSLGS
ncbi:MAG: hypothetical protein CMI26_09020 [Opitutae bacterium]|nr:hypothetical protein [Opitutae bacterium]